MVYIKKIDKNECKCAQCDNAINRYPSQIQGNNQFCNIKCKALWQKENLKGKNNPFYGKTHTKETMEKIAPTLFKKGMVAINKGIGKTYNVICKICKKKIVVSTKVYNKNKNKKFFCSRNCWSKQGFKVYCDYCGKRLIRRKCELKYKHIFCNQVCRIKWISETGFVSNEKNPMWKGGISFEPYGLDFSKKLRKAIKERDGYCMLCNIGFEDLKLLKRKVAIHHIDYKKTNNFPQNLITLCNKCHGLTNHNRKRWIIFLQSLLTERYNYQYSQDQKIILDYRPPERRGEPR